MREETEMVNDITRAKLAESFINNPLFIEGMAVLKATTLDKFESLEFDDVAVMQDCNRMLKVIDNFEQMFIAVVERGKSALQALEDIQTHQEALNNDRTVTDI